MLRGLNLATLSRIGKKMSVLSGSPTEDGHREEPIDGGGNVGRRSELLGLRRTISSVDLAIVVS